MKLGERGRRTDEIIAASRRLLTERDVSFEGATTASSTSPSIPARLPELWVRRLEDQEALSPTRPYIAPPCSAHRRADGGSRGPREASRW